MLICLRVLAMRKNKLYISDIDDTLVKENGKPNKELIAEIENIAQKNTMFILATARAVDSVKERFGKIKIKIISRSRSVNYR